MTNRWLNLACCSILAIGIGSCSNFRIGTLFPVSDVPCFQPTAWSPGGAWELIRTIPDIEGALLITQQTSDQIGEDRNDGDMMSTYFPHDPVYLFSPDTMVFELVDDSMWDNLTTPIYICWGTRHWNSPFEQLGSGLLFNEQEISVVGGALVDIVGSSSSAALAALSTDGSILTGFFVIPGRLVEPSGQHFHQLFSRVDGSPVSDAVRVGIVGPVNMCWTFGEKYVMYAGVNSNRVGTICIVPIEDNLPQFGN